MIILSVLVIAIMGFIISVYTYLVEYKLKTNRKYKAICDVNNKISCSKALLSNYSNLFGISNSVKGIIFYILIIFLSFFNINYVFYLSIISVLGSIFLAYISYFKLKIFCLICTAIYVVNILLLIVSYYTLF